MQETWVQSLGREDPLEKGMATHSSILAWRIPWREEPSWLHSMGLQRVGYHWVTNTQYRHLSVSVDFTSTVSTNELPFSWISECRTLSTERWLYSLYCTIISTGFELHRLGCLSGFSEPISPSTPFGYRERGLCKLSLCRGYCGLQEFKVTDPFIFILVNFPCHQAMDEYRCMRRCVWAQLACELADTYYLKISYLSFKGYNKRYRHKWGKWAWVKNLFKVFGSLRLQNPYPLTLHLTVSLPLGGDSFRKVGTKDAKWRKVIRFLLKYFPGGSDGKESTCNVWDLSLIPGLGRSPGGGHGYQLQYSCLENPHGRRSLVGYSPWGHRESDTTERLSAHRHTSSKTNDSVESWGKGTWCCIGRGEGGWEDGSLGSVGQSRLQVWWGHCSFMMTAQSLGALTMTPLTDFLFARTKPVSQRG